MRTDLLADGWRAWADFQRDAGRYPGFVRAIGTALPSEAMNYYDPALGAVVGVDR